MVGTANSVVRSKSLSRPDAKLSSPNAATASGQSPGSIAAGLSTVIHQIVVASRSIASSRPDRAAAWAFTPHAMPANMTKFVQVSDRPRSFGFNSTREAGTRMDSPPGHSVAATQLIGTPGESGRKGNPGVPYCRDE